MEKTITKEALKNELYSGIQPAIELLYTMYSDMLYSYIMQFTTERQEADDLLVRIFTHLSGRLQEACNSSLSIYCWLQTESRRIILHYKKQDPPSFANGSDHYPENGQKNEAYYFTLLQEASYDQRLVFRELFLNGRAKEELASHLGWEVPYIEQSLKESLVIISKNLT